MPAARSIFRRAQEDEQFRAQYDLACRIRAGRYAEELARLANRAENATTTEQVHALKLMVNTRQWVVSKLLLKYHDQNGRGDLNLHVSNKPARHFRGGAPGDDRAAEAT